MLSLYQLKNLCRVCMVKIEVCDDEGYDSNNVVLSHFPEIESLIHVCLDASTMVDNDEVDFDTYMPNLCRFCFEKWSDFFKYYRMLMRTEEKLRELVIKELQWVGDTKLPHHVEEEVCL